MKRVWRRAAVAAAADGYGLQLDGKPLRLPGGLGLRAASLALAEALAAEWNGVSGDFSIESLPLTRLTATAQEHVRGARASAIEALTRFGATDLVCYRATFPPALAARQAALWDPLLREVRERFGAALLATEGVMPARQPDAALEALSAAFAAQNDAVLAALLAVVPATSSAVIGLCLAADAIGAQHAADAAFVDEDFSAAQWGADAEAEARRARIAADIAAAEKFMRLSGATRDDAG